MSTANSVHRASRDIRTLTEFRANAAAFVEQVQSTNAPIILTQRGRGAAVLIGITAYEALLDEVGLFRDVRLAEAQADVGGVRPGDVVATRIRAFFGR